MHTLPYFNWSIQKALATLPDSFSKARVRIVYTILLFSLLKAAVVVGFAIPASQSLQFARAVIALVVYATLLKILLYDPFRLRMLSHIMLSLGVILIWTNIFIYTHKINLPTLQFVFMVILTSFYTLGRRPGIFYSVAAMIPVLVLLFSKGGRFLITGSPEELPSPGFEIIIVLNFLTIIFAHYFFYKALDLNIREKEKLNKQLELAAAEAKRLAESRSGFLSTMSHELRTPLNSVVGITELLLQEKQEEAQKENLDLLRYSALDLLSLINNVLDINKLDSEKLELEHTPFKLYQLVHNICSVLRIKARDKHLVLVLEVDEPIKHITVTSDPTRLSQVIYNIVGNAIKFTERGTINVKLQLLSEDNGHAEILFSINDTGIGIAPERHQSIFESFTQAEAGTTRKYGGTGLGLTIVKQVLLLFNSSVNLESTPGTGSLFFFRISFPVVAGNADETPAIDNTDTDLSHLKILVAEDNEVNKLVLQKQMRSLNITPVMVSDGIQAYEAYVSGDYDAVLLDLDMPGWDGYETSRQIRLYAGTKQNPYIIAFTASALGPHHLTENGFDDFLYKPVSMKDLRQKLERVVSESNWERAH